MYAKGFFDIICMKTGYYFVQKNREEILSGKTFLFSHYHFFLIALYF